MDTVLAQTFLEIVATGSFIRAADRLNVSQTTVSARVRTLEEHLGAALFVRNKAGATLTRAGERFLRYAPTLVQLWQRARHQIELPPGHRASLALAAEATLWEPLLVDWMLWMRRAAPDVALRVKVDLAGHLMRQVADGVIDIAVLYAPQHSPGLKVDLLLDEKLVLVATDPERVSEGYVQVDWSTEFSPQFSPVPGEASGTGLFFEFGPLALRYILETGGAGYFRRRAVEVHLAAGRLHLVPGAPEFSYPIYAVHQEDADVDLVGLALAGLHEVARPDRPASILSRPI